MISTYSAAWLMRAALICQCGMFGASGGTPSANRVPMRMTTRPNTIRPKDLCNS